MKYEAVIFDLDGVICHTDQYHYLAWKEFADKLDIYFDKEINNRLRGVSRMDSLEIILERYKGTPLSKDDKLNYAEEKNSFYKTLLKGMSPDDVSCETKNTLEILRNKGLELAIGSSSKNAKYILRQVGLEGFFDAISDGTNIEHSKPNPEVFLKASEYLGVDPKECLIVEDAKAGVEAAANAGMDSAAIGDAAYYNLATYNISSLSELLYLIHN